MSRKICTFLLINKNRGVSGITEKTKIELFVTNVFFIKISILELAIVVDMPLKNWIG